MARTKTLLQLRTLARQYADAESTTHVTDTELTGYINDSLAALHAAIVERDEDEYAVETTISLPANATSVDILTPPAAPYKILFVSAQVSPGDWRPLDRFSWSARPALDSTSAGDLYPLSYRWRGANKLEVAPAPVSATTLKVVYVTSAVDLVADADTFDGKDGWDRWVCWDSAIKIMIKEETDARAATAERDRAWAQIVAQFSARDRANPDVVQDVTGRRELEIQRRRW